MNTSTLEKESVDDVSGVGKVATFHASSLAWKRLLWKEFKQILPLVITLVGIGILLQLLGLLTAKSSPETFHGAIFVLIPSLLAVGIGPMLVSQEKELRTLSWIGSLPIQRSTIVISKMIVSVVALGLAWLVGIIVVSVVCPTVFRRGDLFDKYAILWPINTFFIAMLSFSLAWICPTAISALITLLPVAAMPLLLASLQIELFPGTWLHDSSRMMPSLLASILNYGIVAILVAAIADRYGRLSFVSSRSPNNWITWWNGLDIRYRPTSHALASTQGMVPSLLWQITKQNRLIAVFASSIVILPCVAYFFRIDFGFAPASVSDAIIVSVGAVAALLLCWLGASVFGSDGTKQRIRFLADRGVSPGLVWWTRQIIPLSVASLALGCWYVLYDYATANEPIGSYSPRVVPLPWMIIGLLTIAIYASTQWCSQWIRSSLVAFCVAPAVAIGAIAYGAFAVTSLGSSLWLVAVSVVIAFVASYVMMRPWMDGRFDTRYWMSQFGFLFASILVPAIPFLITYATVPGIPSSVQSTMLQEATSFGKDKNALELMVAKKKSEHMNAQQYDEKGQPTRQNNLRALPAEQMDATKSVQEVMAFLESQLAGHAGPIVGSTYGGIAFAYREASLASIRLDLDSAEPSTIARYTRAVMLLNSISERLRLRGRLLEQEFADRLDCWLVLELKKPNRREALGSENYSKLARRLADQPARNLARRRAILMSWAQFLQPNEGTNFGGMRTPAYSTPSMATASIVRDRYVGRAAHQLLEYLDQKESSQFDTIRAIWRPSMAFVSDDRQDASLSVPPFPGALWHRAWERDAQSLVAEL
ncbi:MAG: ABC-2 transporter permease [Planctomycetota bacterium]|nr:ABC-2 transporter permease [Planctomycetota bacterium]